jgi:hypothetical protein
LDTFYVKNADSILLKKLYETDYKALGFKTGSHPWELIYKNIAMLLYKNDKYSTARNFIERAEGCISNKGITIEVINLYTWVSAFEYEIKNYGLSKIQKERAERNIMARVGEMRRYIEGYEGIKKYFGDLLRKRKLLGKTIVFLSLLNSFGIIPAQQNDTLSKNVTLDEVSVIGRKAPSVYKQVARKITIITREEIASAPAQSLQDLLEYAASIDVRQRNTHGVQADIQMRAGTFDQVMVLLNGVNITDPQTGHFNLDIPVELSSIERIEILRNLRLGKFDVLVGINLLREGLDLPEVSLVAILDADKEGFLRSDTTLIQICGRAARNVDGRVIFYADRITGSMERALAEMNRRRKRQVAYNTEHHITPRSIVKAVQKLEEFEYKAKEEGLTNMVRDAGAEYVSPNNISRVIAELDKQMREAADNLDFETAAVLRDQMVALREMQPRSGSRPKRPARP